MHLPDQTAEYAPHRERLLSEARRALVEGVKSGHPPVVDLAKYPDILRKQRATFITLEKRGQLRGCIGHLEASQPLILDVMENTVAAALEDPRFEPVTADETKSLTISISILTPPEPMQIQGEADLLRQLRPGVDGLIIGEGRRRATFLPSVWDELPDPAEFVQHLKRKAGWSARYWSDAITASRYQSIYITDQTKFDTD